jgi:hypothetical protein
MAMYKVCTNILTTATVWEPETKQLFQTTSRNKVATNASYEITQTLAKKNC